MNATATLPLSGSSITAVPYRDWRDAYVLSNRVVEASIIPAAGRVMQFRFAGESAGVFWENSGVSDDGWLNYGGDKAWPAPQKDWNKICGRAWPPPAGFDSVPFTATVHDDTFIMASPVDDQFGIQITREISLLPQRPVMRIATTFQKLCGTPVRVAVWVVTQLQDPERVFAAIPKHGPVPVFTTVIGTPPPDLRIDGDLLSFRRSRTENVKLAVTGASLLWVGHKFALCVNTASGNGAITGSRTAVYTNKDPLAYVELETEGPTRMLTPGDRVSQTNTYILARRTVSDAQLEAQRWFTDSSVHMVTR